MPDASFDDASSWPALGGVKGRAGAVAIGTAVEVWPPLIEEAERARSDDSSALRGRDLHGLKRGRSRTDSGEFTEALVVSMPGILTLEFTANSYDGGRNIVTVSDDYQGHVTG
jgi:hypothetical protein